MRYFKLFSCCIPVRGKYESVIYDLGRGDYIKIDNLLYEVLQKSDGVSIEELKMFYNNKFDKGIESYFNLFVKEEIGFYTDDPQMFPDLSLSWDSPYKISNAILEIDSRNGYDIVNTLEQLNELGCRDIQLIFIDIFKIDWLGNILDKFMHSRFRSYQIFMPYDTTLNTQIYIDVIERYKRIAGLIIYNAPNKMGSIDKKTAFSRLFITESTLNYDKTVEVKDFIVSMDTFTEAQHFNIALNRKISICADGTMKNFLSFCENFGNVNQIKISDVIEDMLFKKKWNINNDVIEICRECEYRYMCTSNSDIFQDEDKWYKTIYCDHNSHSDSSSGES